MLTLDYASNQTARPQWGPILFKPSARSLILTLLTAATIAWIAERLPDLNYPLSIAAASPVSRKLITQETSRGVESHWNLWDLDAAPAADHTPVPRPQTQIVFSHAQFSPDGPSFLFAADMQEDIGPAEKPMGLGVCDLRRLQPKVFKPGCDTGIAAFSQDGRRIVVNRFTNP